MEIYTPINAPYQIRLQIIKVGFNTEHLSLINTTLDETQEMIQKVIEAQKISPLIIGRVTNINIREWLPYPKSVNGEQLSVSLRGIDPKDVLKLITEHFTNK